MASSASKRTHHAGVPHDDDAIGDGEDLVQFVGDEDDARPRVGELAHDAEELVRLLWGEHGGGLVQNQHARLAVERLEDLDALLCADGQVAHDGVRVDRERVAARDVEDVLVHLTQVDDARADGRLVAEHDVLGDGQGRDEHEVLVHHADAARDRVAG